MNAALAIVSLFCQLGDLRFDAWDPKMLALADKTPHFLTRDALLALPVPPPPANDDLSTRKELDELLELQRTRTAAQKKDIVAHKTFLGLSNAILGTIQRELAKAPKTRALLEHVEWDGTVAVFTAKKRFQRARPHQLEPRLHPAIDVPKHASYPSGHAIFGQLVALTLSEIFPDYREVLMKAGTQIGREREIAGVHYPSDSAASRALADQVFALLLKNEKFKKELAAAKTEWPCQGQ